MSIQIIPLDISLMTKGAACNPHFLHLHNLLVISALLSVIFALFLLWFSCHLRKKNLINYNLKFIHLMSTVKCSFFPPNLRTPANKKQNFVPQIFDISFISNKKFFNFYKLQHLFLMTRKVTLGRCATSSERKENHTTFHEGRMKWLRVSASITVKDRIVSNKDTGGTAAFQGQEETEGNLLGEQQLVLQEQWCISRSISARQHTENLPVFGNRFL